MGFQMDSLIISLFRFLIPVPHLDSFSGLFNSVFHSVLSLGFLSRFFIQVPQLDFYWVPYLGSLFGFLIQIPYSNSLLGFVFNLQIIYHSKPCFQVPGVACSSSRNPFHCMFKSSLLEVNNVLRVEQIKIKWQKKVRVHIHLEALKEMTSRFQKNQYMSF